MPPLDPVALAALPIGTTNAQAFARNASDLDSVVNGTSSVTTRTGKSVLSLDEALRRIGYEPPVAFASGLSIARATQTVIYSGLTYHANPVSTPFTTTGTFNSAQWLLVSNITAQDLAGTVAGKGSDLVSVPDSMSGSIDRSVTEWLLDGPLSVLRTGADPSGAVDSSSAIQLALSKKGDIVIPDGVYLINSNMSFGDNTTIRFSKNAKLKAGVNGLTFFTTTTAYHSSVFDATLDGNGKTGVTGFDLSNMRLSAGLFDCSVENMATGIIARYGCFGTQIANLNSWRVPAPIVVLGNSSVLDISHPTLDNSTSIGGSGTGTGVRVSYGSGDNIGVRIHGGYVQGFAIGIHDSGIGTNVSDLYLEVCSTADVYGDQCRESTYSGLQHFGPSGATAYLLQLTDAVTINGPVMASGARTTLYNIDSSNTSAHEMRPESAAYLNTPTGSLANIRPVNQYKSAWTPVVSGSSSAGSASYSVASGVWTRQGKTVWFSCEVTWTGHTGTGNISISGMPASSSPSTYTPAPVFQVHVSGVAFTGPVLCAGLSGVGSVMSLQQISTAGGVALVPISSSGSIRVTGTYSL